MFNITIIERKYMNNVKKTDTPPDLVAIELWGDLSLIESTYPFDRKCFWVRIIRDKLQINENARSDNIIFFAPI